MEKKQVNYNVALYIRLSREDGDKEESESVTNQRKILRAFVKENNYNIFDEYVDDGYSGTNFDRPSFQRMIRDIEANQVNMVVTKTLSRLGRDYIETGRYIENYFPEHNVRYIAVLDDVDTYLDKNSEMVAFKNVMNDYYAKETSKNIKRTKYKKVEEGFYYTAFAPLGYKKIDIKGNVEVIESQAKIVRRIFDEFLSGKGTYQISKLLNKEKIPRPANQIEMYSKRYKDTEMWDHNAVRRILSNQMYIGDVVQHKKRKISYKSKKEIRVPKEEQVIIKNHHEPIVEIEKWKLAQVILDSNKTCKRKENEHLLKPFIYCGDCFEKMYILKGGEKYKGEWKYRYHLTCCSVIKHRKNKNIEMCINSYINYNQFEKNVLSAIYNQLENYINNKGFNKNLAKNNYISRNNKASEDKKINQKIEKIQNEIFNIDRKLEMLYNDRLNEIIDASDYALFSKNLKSKKENLGEMLKEAVSIKNDLNKEDDDDAKIDENIEKQIQLLLKNKKIEQSDLYQLIKRIEVDHNKNISIIFNFKELNNEGVKDEKTV